MITYVYYDLLMQTARDPGNNRLEYVWERLGLVEGQKPRRNGVVVGGSG